MSSSIKVKQKTGAYSIPPPPPEGNDTNTISSTDQQQKNEEWVMSGYGHDQVYVNAASLERYRSLPLATTNNNTNITSNNRDRSNTGSSDGSEIKG